MLMDGSHGSRECAERFEGGETPYAEAKLNGQVA
jgi:hypothetical protein